MIGDNCQAKHFGKSYFQCDIGMDLPGYRKPSAVFYYFKIPMLVKMTHGQSF